MNDENDITTAAKNFVERFGKDAPNEAQRRATEMRLFGKTDGYNTWMRIFEKVRNILENSPEKSQ